MQMQPIYPLCPLVAEAEEIQSKRGENFNDSLLAVQSKSDSIRNSVTDYKTKQDDDLIPVPLPGPEEVADTSPMVVAQSGDRVAAGSEGKLLPNAKQISAEPQEITLILTIPPVVQSQIMINLPDGSRTEEMDLPGNQINTFLPAAAIENLEPITDQAQPQALYTAQTLANPSPPRVKFEASWPGNRTPRFAVTIVEDLMEPAVASFLPNSQSIPLQEQSELPQPLTQPMIFSDHLVCVIPDTISGHDQKTASLPDLRFVELLQKTGKGESPGRDILCDQSPSIDPPALHPSAGEKNADVTSVFIPMPNTPASTVIGHIGSTAKFSQSFVAPGHQLVDNVIQQVSLRTGEGQGRSISIQLHPEELGRLKMDLSANDEKIKAHIHVQSLLTQEILEKHLHRLREGFAQQGLILDEIQVSVGSDTSSGPGPFNDQHTLHARTQHANAMRPKETRETAMAETMVAPFRSDGSISLRI